MLSIFKINEIKYVATKGCNDLLQITYTLSYAPS